MLTDRHVVFFQTFGYLHVPGYFADDIGWILEEFESAWRSCTTLSHDGSKRTIFPSTFVGATPRLAALIEHPLMISVCTSLLGPGYGFQGGDGNFYSGDTGWHSDAFGVWPEKTTVRHLKIAFYLDHLTRETGALRVIPGSHHDGDRYCTTLEAEVPPWLPNRVMNIEGPDVPCVAIESRPGDLVCFDHRTKHAAFGGGARRRMFATNWMQGATTPAQRKAVLENYRFYRDHEKVDWRIREDWYLHPPAARQPMLAQLREYTALVLAEQEAQQRVQVTA